MSWKIGGSGGSSNSGIGGVHTSGEEEPASSSGTKGTKDTGGGGGLGARVRVRVRGLLKDRHVSGGSGGGGGGGLKDAMRKASNGVKGLVVMAKELLGRLSSKSAPVPNMDGDPGISSPSGVSPFTGRVDHKAGPPRDEGGDSSSPFEDEGGGGKGPKRVKFNSLKNSVHEYDSEDDDEEDDVNNKATRAPGSISPFEDNGSGDGGKGLDDMLSMLDMELLSLREAVDKAKASVGGKG